MSRTVTQRVFLLPDLGEGLTEAEIIEWRVSVGDMVEVDQPVVEVETAKAAVDVPCPYAGRVIALHGRPGEVRPVGQPLLTVEPLTAEPAGAAVETPRDEPAGHATYREEERAGSGNVLIGYGTGHGPAGARRRRRVATGAPARSESVRPATATGPVPPTGQRLAMTNPVPAQPNRPEQPQFSSAAGLVISPLVRRFARENGIDVATLRGSGPGGIIRRADVIAAIAAARAGQSSLGSGTAESTVTSTEVGGVQSRQSVPSGLPGPDVVVPLRGVRRAVADKLSRSRREIPEVTIWVDVDATELLATRAAINAARPERPVSVLALFARICLHALRRFPELNSRVDLEREQIVQSGRVHLGIAAQTDRGLVVPVITDAQHLNTTELAAALAEVTVGARAGTLPPSRLTGGTFTLNNYGVFGVDGSTPIINHPEAALLGIGRIVDKPWVVEGQLAVRKVTQLSLTFDHRVCDGGVAGGFIRHVADCVERPALFIADV